MLAHYREFGEEMVGQFYKLFRELQKKWTADQMLIKRQK